MKCYLCPVFQVLIYVVCIALYISCFSMDYVMLDKQKDGHQCISTFSGEVNCIVDGKTTTIDQLHLQNCDGLDYCYTICLTDMFAYITLALSFIAGFITVTRTTLFKKFKEYIYVLLVFLNSWPLITGLVMPTLLIDQVTRVYPNPVALQYGCALLYGTNISLILGQRFKLGSMK